jgi:hypothetical protein
MPDLAIVLVKQPTYGDPDAVVATARKLGITLQSTGSKDPQEFTMDGDASMLVMLVPVPVPDADKMATGPTAVTREEAAAAPAHLLVTVLGLRGTTRERDTRLAALTAAVIDNTPAVAVTFGPGVVPHKARLFSEMAALGMQEGLLPPEMSVDITTARETDERMSFLTHGMARHGREELYVTCPIQGKGALDFVFGMVRWLLDDPPKELPTGDTLGRSATEKILIQRVPNPTGQGPAVMRLDLPS